MIELNFRNIMEFKHLTDKEQGDLCLAVVNEFERLRKPLYDRAQKEYRASSNNMPFLFHDWLRIRSNLKSYAEPNKLDEDKYLIRWNTLWELYHICKLLEYINFSFGLKDESE